MKNPMTRLVTLGALAAVMSGCTIIFGQPSASPLDEHLRWISIGMFGGVEKSSPAQSALGGRVTVPLFAGSPGLLSGTVGVQRQWWDGGHDNVFTFGAQGRRPVGDQLWLGAEATYNNWRVSDGFQDPIANVWGFGGLAGYRLGDSPFSVTGSASILGFGDFESDGNVIYEGSTGWQLSLGFEVAPPAGN